MDGNPPMMVVVALALLSTDGKVLVQQRAAGKAHGGLWEFPGGKVEAGEAPEAALVREIAEELGVIVESYAITPLSFATSFAEPGKKAVLLLLYTATRWCGSPKALEAGTQINWVSAPELLALPMPPLDIPLAQALIPVLDGLVIEGVAKGKRPT
ncbi:MAG: DNA mismatch repair protein MutT [Novosphingobium sp. 32-60-15]|uniref:(deoxy)nucleoside triphosphate pyrophosphohydrolase n=1 Tax=unclassified Novosphingobium TaxID=2644732 RepID=UPI000BDC84BF|nr:MULTISPECIES: (deoxy)nucleoside triphosphate pyrophosphohydrolase [unclassified Novosphingobium]OYX63701.1 MAG: DNA mismatch repair protein MutT [Novosphingobium sp. 32-60-15]